MRVIRVYISLRKVLKYYLVDNKAMIPELQPDLTKTGLLLAFSYKNLRVRDRLCKRIHFPLKYN